MQSGMVQSKFDKKYQRRKMWLDILQWALLYVVLVVLVLNVFVLERIMVQQQSMMPTLLDGQVVWGNKIAIARRGDIVVFDYSEPNGTNTVLIKRMVAKEGDKVWVTLHEDQYVLHVCTPDGQVLAEYYTYLGRSVELQPMYYAGILAQYNSIDVAYTIPQGHMLPIGDNRPVSSDGRSFGVIPIGDIIAVVID